MRRFSMVEIADQTNEALKLERKGEREKANRLMRQSIQAAAPYISAEMNEEYQKLSEQMLDGLDEQTRKSNHEISYLRKQRRN